jgi:hypothetical protein
VVRGFGRLARRKLARRAPKPMKLSKIGGRLVGRLKRKKKEKEKKREKGKLVYFVYFVFLVFKCFVEK